MTTRCLPIRGDELARLLAPIDTTTFATDYWGRRPLHIRGGADRYAGLFGRDAFFRAVASGPRAPRARGFHIRARFDRRAAQGELVPELSIAPEQVAEALRAGATICVNAIDACDEALEAYACAIKAQLGYPGDVRFNAYLSPDGCGAPIHFDARIATTLQIAGAKRWRYSREAAVTWPRGNGIYHPDGTGSYHFVGHGDAPWEEIARIRESEFEEVVLEPGDLLCLPAGTWHACDAHGESLALNLAFEPVGPLEVLQVALQQRLEHDPTWRSVAPIPVGSHGELTEAVDQYLDERLAGLARAIAELRADRAVSREAWARATVAPAAGGAARRREPFPAARAIERDTMLSVHRTASTVWSRGDDADGTVTATAWVGDARVEVAAGAAALVLGALAARTFRADAGLAWADPVDPMTWDDVRTTLEHLVDAGVLQLL